MLKKKILCLTMSLLMLTVLFCNDIDVCANDADEFEIAISNIMEENRIVYAEDPEFYREAEDKGISFDELLRQKAISAYFTRERLGICDIVPYGLGNNGQCLYTNIPLIQQTKKYNCGPTAALQVLYGMACQSQVAGQTDAEKIAQLERDSGTDASGTIVYKLTNTLNKYTQRTNYRYILGSGMTKEDFHKKLETSLFYDYAPILHARTQYLLYYKGHKSGHYIAVCEVDNSAGTVRLKDCNYNNDFFGQHNVTLDEAYESINVESSRYLICMEY